MANYCNKKLLKKDYMLDPFKVATDILLGAYLCTNVDNKLCVGKITEVEVYIGCEDKACHAYKNKTPRNSIMFEEGGVSYVYFVYGMYNMFNIVTNEKDVANAILVRSVEPVDGIDIMMQRRGLKNIKNLTTGPGKLCQAFGIDGKLHGADLINSNEIWICPKDNDYEVLSGKRIGIDYAEEYKDMPWRFVIKDNKFISKKIS